MEEIVSVMYNHYNVRLHRNQLQTYIELFNEMKVELKDYKCTITSSLGDSINLHLIQIEDHIYIEQTFHVADPTLADLFRHTIGLYEVNANILYGYADAVLVYTYTSGILDKVVEKSGEKEKVIYEFKLLANDKLHKNNLLKKINTLLDQRNVVTDLHTIQSIDEKLKQLQNDLKKVTL